MQPGHVLYFSGEASDGILIVEVEDGETQLLTHVTQRVRKCCYKQEAHNGQEPV